MSSETTPLLNGVEPQIEIDSPESPPQTKPSVWQSLFHHWQKWKVLYLCVLVIMTVDAAAALGLAPGISLLERVVCRDYYQHASRNSVPIVGHRNQAEDDLCSVPEVQGRVANVKGTLEMLQTLPGIITAVPYGILADSRGRKFVIALGIMGVILSSSWALLVFSSNGLMPLWTLYLFPQFLYIGGGGFVLGTVLLAIVADVIPSDIRTKMFFLLGVLSLAIIVIIPPIGSQLMSHYGPIFTYAITIPLLLIPLVILRFIPQTYTPKDNRAVLAEPEIASPVLDNSGSLPRAWNIVKEKYHMVHNHIYCDILPILKSTTVLRGMIGIFVVSFSECLTTVLMQYMHVRFKWRYEDAVSVMSFEALAHILTLCTVMPFLHSLFIRCLHDSENANLLLMKVCVLFHFIGAVIMGMSEQPRTIFFAIAVSMLGSGFGASARSFLTSLVPKNEIALLYTIFSIFAAFGSLAGAPLLALAFSLGIALGGWFIGLPYFLVALLFALYAVIIWSIKPQPRQEAEEV